MVNNKIILPLAEPLVKAYGSITFPLMILGNNEKYLQYYYSNFIQLEWTTINNGVCTFFRGGYNPLLQYQEILKNTLISNYQLHTFIVNAINDEWYIQAWVDEFYLPQKTAYGKYHAIHNNLLYGYDNDREEYVLTGMTDEDVFKTTMVKCKDFEKAMYNLLMSDDRKIMNIDEDTRQRFECQLMKVDDSKRYDFDLRLVFDMLNDYYYSYNSSERFQIEKNRTKEKTIYGMSIYKYLIRYFELLKLKKVYSDRRMLHILWEQKKIMVFRIKYICQLYGFEDYQSILSSYEKIRDSVLTARNLQLKYDITNDNTIIDKIIPLIENIIAEETTVLKLFLKNVADLLVSESEP